MPDHVSFARGLQARFNNKTFQNALYKKTFYNFNKP